MKKWIGAALLLAAIVAMGSCTNDEDGTGIDLLTPSDSTSAKSAPDQ
ncbi:hypothetical protein [Poritiphilus flavus]|uniref:Lipoprotein n=1 Tax=Poritiphilus flavus TaxID=2697053 RepID=A0A6L9EHX9_9FLAO|nr:hypothetical protein [Poritiphilus flavus]NAS14255.1 hypothetical protein [Poritiphilus flavus]